MIEEASRTSSTKPIPECNKNKKAASGRKYEKAATP